jgi:hypothetical protein
MIYAFSPDRETVFSLNFLIPPQTALIWSLFWRTLDAGPKLSHMLRNAAREHEMIDDGFVCVIELAGSSIPSPK